MLIPATAVPPTAARATATSRFLVKRDFITALLLVRIAPSGVFTGPIDSMMTGSIPHATGVRTENLPGQAVR
jgi:hypothetical protein